MRLQQGRPSLSEPERRAADDALGELLLAQEEYEVVKEQRDRAVLRAVNSGARIDDIGQAIGMKSHGGVRVLIKRIEERGRA